MIFLSWVALCFRLLVAAVFVTYACGKLRRPSQFAAVIRSHRLIPNALSGATAWGLTLLELVLGILFLFNVFPLIVGIAIGALLILFNAVLLRARLTPRLNVTGCGCSGTSNRKATLEKAFFRNLVLLCVVVAVVVTVGLRSTLSSSLLLYIECILLACILIGVVGSQTRLFSALLRAFNIQLVRRQDEGTSVAIMQGERRSFIKWGVQLGIAAIVGAGVLWTETSDVLAYNYEPCPSGEDCDCGAGGSGPWSGSDDCEQYIECEGHAGQLVPIQLCCWIYCCGSGDECRYECYDTGEEAYCGSSGGGC